MFRISASNMLGLRDSSEWIGAAEMIVADGTDEYSEPVEDAMQ